MMKVLTQKSRMQYKTEDEYLDEKNLGKPLIKSDNFEIY